MAKEHESDSEEQSTEETEEGGVSESSNDRNDVSEEEEENPNGVDEYGYDDQDRATFEANGFDPLANTGPTRRFGGRAGRRIAGSAFRGR
jgi:hypothetical protein